MHPCPHCQKLCRFDEFRPAPWCSDAMVLHDLCRMCQEEERVNWAYRLNRFFLGLHPRRRAA